MLKEARSILNELTLTNSDRLSNELAHLEIQGPRELLGLVSIILDKALEEHHLREKYAKLCKCIIVKGQMKEFQDEVDPVKKVTFKKCLLNKCQEEFDRSDRYNEMNYLDAAAKANKTRVARNRMLGNITFIGELFAQKILNEKIMHCCVKRLSQSKEEDAIECLCTLLATIGKLLDREEARHYMDRYFEQMKQTANEIGCNPAQFPSGVRLKVMILYTLDLRKNGYVLPFVFVVCLATCLCCM